MERFFDYFEPEHYDLDFRISANKTRLTGTAIITGVAKAEQIKLHAEKLRISDFEINGKNADYAREKGTIIIDGLEKSKKVTLEFDYLSVHR